MYLCKTIVCEIFIQCIFGGRNPNTLQLTRSSPCHVFFFFFFFPPSLSYPLTTRQSSLHLLMYFHHARSRLFHSTIQQHRMTSNGGLFAANSDDMSTIIDPFERCRLALWPKSTMPALAGVTSGLWLSLGLAFSLIRMVSLPSTWL